MRLLEYEFIIDGVAYELYTEQLVGRYLEEFAYHIRLLHESIQYHTKDQSSHYFLSTFNKDRMECR